MRSFRLTIALLAAAGGLLVASALLAGGAADARRGPQRNAARQQTTGPSGVTGILPPPATTTATAPSATTPPPETTDGPTRGAGHRRPGHKVTPGIGTPVAPVQAPPAPAVAARPSRALGLPYRGRLVDGVLFPAEGPDWFTWNTLEGYAPNDDWRRVTTDAMAAFIPAVLARFRAEHPGAPRIGVQDLSLPEGGVFGPEYGGLGHASHQNGLDADIAYPRKDRQERGSDRLAGVDRPLAQALVTAFVKAGAQFVFVGPHTGFTGPKAVVQVVAYHDDHLHVRIPNPHPADARVKLR